jgi:phosphodiesterase/alkaline phosphatase D-like protein
MHTVIMTDLKPDTYYYYQYGHEAHGLLSHVRRFKSRPPKSTKYANFIAYADMGTYHDPGSSSTASRVYEDVVGGGYDSFLLHFGDIR